MAGIDLCPMTAAAAAAVAGWSDWPFTGVIDVIDQALPANSGDMVPLLEWANLPSFLRLILPPLSSRKALATPRQ